MKPAGRPDIDMLACLAEKLALDINELIYGLRIPENRNLKRKRLATAFVCLAVMAALLIWLEPIVFELQRKYYFVGPRMVLRMGFGTVFYLLLGVNLMRVGEYFLQLKPIKSRWAGNVKIVIFTVLLLALLLILPVLLSALAETLEIVWPQASSWSEIMKRVFNYWPWDRALVNRIMIFLVTYPAVFTAFGASMWIFSKDC